MAMESRLYQSRRDPPPAWLPAFGTSAEQALQTLSDALRNPDASARRSRIDVETPTPGTGGNELMETEADRVPNQPSVAWRGDCETQLVIVETCLFFARYEYQGSVHYGLVNQDKITELRGGLFDPPLPTGREVAVDEVKLLAPCELPKCLQSGSTTEAIWVRVRCRRIPEYFISPCRRPRIQVARS